MTSGREQGTVAFHLDGHLLVSAGNDKTLRFWALEGDAAQAITAARKRVQGLSERD